MPDDSASTWWWHEREVVLLGRVAQLVGNQTLLDPGGSTWLPCCPSRRPLPITQFEHRVTATPGGQECGQHACILTVVGCGPRPRSACTRVREDHLTQELFGRPSRDSPDLLLVLHTDSGQPLRTQLREAIRDAIRTGRLPSGARLPSSRALAADFGVSRGVVVDAYAQLVAEGYLTSQLGSDTHVADTFQLPRAEQPAHETPAPRPALLVDFDLRADRSDPALFPRRKWVSATRDAVRDLADGDLGYPDPRGNNGLRIELASYLRRVASYPFRSIAKVSTCRRWRLRGRARCCAGPRTSSRPVPCCLRPGAAPW